MFFATDTRGVAPPLLRIGANLGLEPDRVYLHTGTRTGARRLGLGFRSAWIECQDLPEALRSLPPWQVEDILCIFKDWLAGLVGRTGRCAYEPSNIQNGADAPDLSCHHVGWERGSLGALGGQNVEQIGYLILGWLFGLLSPNIAERLRRPYVRRELEDSVMAELDEMRYTMASAAYAVNDHLLETTDDFLDWLIPIIRAYEGPRASPTLGPTVEKLRAAGKDARLEILRARKIPGRGVGLKEYCLPFTSAKAADLRICSMRFQRGVFTVLGKVDMFNQQLRHLQRYEELTFNPQAVEANSDAINDNLDRGTRQLGVLARSVVDSISVLERDHKTAG